MKLKTVYICQNCESQSPKWLGKCPQCNSWNSLVEEVVNVGKAEPSKSALRGVAPRSPEALKLQTNPLERLASGIEEWDQVLGGGFMPSQLVLLSGEPGIGKSTLTLQITGKMALQKEKVLYVTGEESVEQVADRAHRLGIQSQNLVLLQENNLENLLSVVRSEKPDFLVVDSVQVMSSEELPSGAGSIGQVRLVTESLMQVIKSEHIPTLLIGHVNKEGQIAGPKVLEHLVDTVLLLEGERDHEFRVLRSLKNRFGSVNEVGFFEMEEAGMRELKNPGEKVLQNRPADAIGSALSMIMEGNRPLLLEVQALVSRTVFGYPKRTASGFDRNRLELLVAVLQKHTDMNFLDQDVYVNVVGGLKVHDPALDLAVCLALSSSYNKKPLPTDLVAFGEVGLTGEVRSVSRMKERSSALEKLGLKKAEIQKIGCLQ